MFAHVLLDPLFKVRKRVVSPEGRKVKAQSQFALGWVFGDPHGSWGEARCLHITHSWSSGAVNFFGTSICGPGKHSRGIE